MVKNTNSSSAGKKAGAPDANRNMIAIAAVVLAVVLLIVVGMPYLNNGQPKTNEPSPQAPQQLEAQALLLASFDKMANLGDYELAHISNQSSAKANYSFAYKNSLIQKGNESWVQIEAQNMRMFGFFGNANASNIVCFAYRNATKCTPVGINGNVTQLATKLTDLIPNKQAYLSQKAQTQKMISTGAMKFAGMTDGGKIGNFEVQKITYNVDYTNLTVQQLLTIGISPSDEELKALANQEFNYWIDRTTGFQIRSLYTYDVNGVPWSSDGEYAVISTAPSKMPDRPTDLAGAETFLMFYRGAVDDYTAMGECDAKNGSEKDGCFKALAVNTDDGPLCERIADNREKENCVAIVAQNTNNKALCEKLPTLSDVCYIGVVGKTGDKETCKNLKNQSLISTCVQAAEEGMRTLEAEQAALQNKMASRNCLKDSDCATVGKYGQFCMPVNATKVVGGEWEPVFDCFKNVTCGCSEGFCGFAKNDTYYKCVADVDEEYIKNFINSMVENKTKTNETSPTTNIGS
ncbi:MAG: hypothetical protein NT051_00180 [Candidatus Micrarchaeota archaeon]|nr:hypothetical protein [Candidatus Micrarchaeota archaeon]